MIALCIGVLLLAAMPALAHVNVFGPKTFPSSQGAPTTVTESILLAGSCDLTPNAGYTLVIASDGISSASIGLNGNEVVKESDFNQQVSTIERTVTLAATNILTVTIKGGSHDGSLTLSIRRHIDLTEAVFAERTFTTTGKSDQFRASFAADPAGSFSIIVSNGPGRVKSASVRLNGVEVVTENELGASTVVRKPVIPAASNELVIDTKSDGAGASLQVAVVRHLADTAGPQIVHGLAEGQVIGATPLVISGTVADPSGVAAFSIDGASVAVGPGGAFSTSIALVEGQNTIAFEATDCEGNTTRREVHVILELAPQLVVLSPANQSATNALTVPVSGTASSTGGIASVTANGHPMTISGASWSGSLTFDSEGVKTITVVATDASNRSTTVSVDVFVDQTGPTIEMTMPTPGVETMYVADTPVGGGIRDALSGLGTVTCNGAPAIVDAGGVFNCTVTLQDGANEITIVGTDRAGNSSSVTRSMNFSPDTVKPVIAATVTPPPNADGWIDTMAEVSFHCSDDRVTPRCSGTAVALQEGAGQVFTGVASDFAGNEATATVTLNIDIQPPVVDIPLVDNALVTNGTVHIVGTATDATSAVKSITCNGMAASFGAGQFDCSVALTAPGWQYVQVVATDLAGNQKTSPVLVRMDNQPPRVEITSPEGSIVTTERTLEVEGTAADDDQIAAVTIAGIDATFTLEGFFATVPLTDGDNTIVVRATDRAGNFSTATITARSFVRPAIRITQPADFAVTANSTITVSGTITGSVAAVDVNGVTATISGTSFSAANVPLQQGRTVITATVRGTNGQIATDDLNIYRDSIPPRVEVYSPASNTVVTASSISVSGMVDDIVIGTINAGQVTVKVNNVTATVANRAFLASNVTLQPGANTLTIVATDRGGNVTTITHSVTSNVTGARILSVSGNGQTAAIGAALAQPLKVRLVNASGAAVAGQDVTFTILQNDGSLAAGATTGRELSVTTDALGEASVQWTLGHRSGAGNNRVRAIASGFAGVVEFMATATTGAPAMVVVDMGNNQYGVSNETLPRPLVAVVVDGGSNRLANVPVTFSVIAGGGSIDGAQSVTVHTDSDGRAFVKPRLGPGNGHDNNTFAATVAGLMQAAVFKSTGRAAGPASETVISGVVLDNTNIPIQGVTIRIDETSRSTQSDARGQFSIANAPVGYVKLIVEGSTAQRPGTWPMLEFIMYTNPGQNNTIGMPIYLLPIDVTRGIQVDERTGGILTIPELPGFSLTIVPGSALFPSGSRAGTISATLVHNDKVPMTPGFGQQPRFIVTIQPPGVHFDPPAALTVPNVDGLQPGEVTEMYSFDHDLGQFVAIGTGAASEDGSTIDSDPGVGIIKSGWHCAGNPAPTGSSGCMTISARAIVPQQPLPAATLTRRRVATQSTSTRRMRISSNATGPAKVAPVGGCVIIEANGNPVNPNLTYSPAEIYDDPNDAEDDPTVAVTIQAPGCTNTPTCTGRIRGLKDGLVTVRTPYVDNQTGQTAYDYVKVRFVDFKLSADELTVNGDVAITKDQIGSLTPITDPIWKKSNAAADNNPVMITPADTLTLLVKFKLDTPLKGELPNVGFTATAAGGGMTGTFTGTQTIPANQQTFEVQFTGSLAGFQSQLINPLTFTFQALPPTDCAFNVAAGTADVKAYSVGRRVNFTVYLSTLHIAASGTQVALNNQNQLQAKVWAKFSNGSGPANVTAWDGTTQLVYYPPGKGFGLVTAGTEGDLLKEGAGRCGSFAPLMGHALALNDVTAHETVVVPSNAVLQQGATADLTKAFLVKKWKLPPFAQTPSVTNQGAWLWIFRSINGANEMYPPPDPNNPRQYGDVESLTGAAGQGTNDPQEKVHYNHAIVKIGTSSWFDPSYGVTYSGPPEFESKSVDGYVNFTVPTGVAASGIVRNPGLGVKFFTSQNPF